MKKSLIIATVCGIAVVVGVALYVTKKKKQHEDIKEQELTRQEPEEDVVSYSDFYEQKSDIASTISERHNAATQIIRETLSEGNDNVRESEHKVDFDEIDSSLDSLLDEE